jgi:glycosyltransferase involved in cell wall biosynthesis
MSESGQIKLSIITVCYNNKEGLRKTMESVKRQEFKNYEYIVIDGGSTDGTLDLIKGNEAFIDYWVSEKDEGIYDAMNKGIKVAKGAYCYFLNSDDCIASPGTLEKIFDETENTDADIIYGNLAVWKNGRLKNVLKLSRKITFYSFYRSKVAIHHQASFIKRELFEKYGYYNLDFTISADWTFFYKSVIIHHVKTQYINSVFAVFLAGGMSYGKNDKEQRAALFKETVDDTTLLSAERKKKRKETKLPIYWEKIMAKIYLQKAIVNKEIDILS